MATTYVFSNSGSAAAGRLLHNHKLIVKSTFDDYSTSTSVYDFIARRVLTVHSAASGASTSLSESIEGPGIQASLPERYRKYCDAKPGTLIDEEDMEILAMPPTPPREVALQSEIRIEPRVTFKKTRCAP